MRRGKTINIVFALVLLVLVILGITVIGFYNAAASIPNGHHFNFTVVDMTDGKRARFFTAKDLGSYN